MPIGDIEKPKDHTIRLNASQVAQLTEIAARMKCKSGSGPSFGQPSWRIMVAGIADGLLVVRKRGRNETSPSVGATGTKS